VTVTALCAFAASFFVAVALAGERNAMFIPAAVAVFAGLAQWTLA
jgi:hypothetical protein